MTVYNREAEHVQSTCTPEELSEALQALHLDQIPPENRRNAIIERLNMVMLQTTTDPKERAKGAFQTAQTMARVMPYVK